MGIMTIPITKLDYYVDHKELQDTVIEFVHQYHWDKSNQLCLLNTPDVEPGNPYQGIPVCRMRLMRVPAKRCYTMHVDGDTDRYHFAVISNENAFFVFKNQQRIQSIPCDGHAYKVHVEEPHTFVNTNSDFDRLHLVLDAAPKS